MNHPVTVIGMGMSPTDLTARHLECIAGADILVGGRRHLAAFAHLNCEKVVIAAPLGPLYERLRRRGDARVVVLASGDPLYYGIGKSLIDALGVDNVVVHPNLTAVAAAFSRIRTPWQDAGVVSLHGRGDGFGELDDALRRHSFVAVFTDPERRPGVLAAWLTRNGWAAARLWIFERMGDPDERVSGGVAGDMTDVDCTDPNLVIVEGAGRPDGLGPVMTHDDEAFLSEGGLITKREVRAVALSLLALARGQVVWDLGAGSGAVAVEMAAFVAPGAVYAVEKAPHRVDLIEGNRRRFQAANLWPVAGVLPGAMDTLPDPDRVFIGGGGADLGGIIENAAARLRPEGRMVVSAVMLSSVETALAAMAQCGLAPEVSQVQANRGVPIAGSRRLEALNPVWLIHGGRRLMEKNA